MKAHHFELTTILLNSAALLLCISAADLIILVLGVLALLFSIGFNKIFNKVQTTNTKLTGLPLIAALMLLSLPLIAAFFFNYLYESIKGAQATFIISFYLIGISATAASSLIKKENRKHPIRR